MWEQNIIGQTCVRAETICMATNIGFLIIPAIYLVVRLVVRVITINTRHNTNANNYH